MSSSSNASDFPADGRLLGVDFGTKRVGFAISTPEQTISCPLENYTRQNQEIDADFVSSLVEEYRVAGLVVGLPVMMSGEEGGKAREAREFGEWLATVTSLPVRFWDERFTSAMAEDLLQMANLSHKKRKQRLDKVAAQILLQSYLDAEDREQTPQPML